jgi:uncharacterized membrane protein
VKSWRLVQHVRSSLWFVPVVCVLAGSALSFGTIAVDRTSGYGLVPDAATGGPDAAIAILTTVATSMVTLTALVLTITMVVVQLAMGQFSPRIVQTILRDKPSQIAIGLFVATFVHAMLGMREVQFGDDPHVPGVAIVVAFVLVVACIVVLVFYVHHIGRSLRVSKLIELVGNDTRKQLDRVFPDRGPALDEPGGRRICADHSGVVVHVDIDRLVHAAAFAGCRLEVEAALGDFVPAGATLATVHGDAHALRDDDVRGGVVLALERSLGQDIAYGLRMLVDIAERSLAESPFTDPTTAVQAIDRLHDCLRQLATRPFPSGRHYDDDGELRLIERVMTWEAYVHLAFDEIRLAGAGSPQVARRLQAALRDLLSVAPSDRAQVLEEQLDLLSAGTEQELSQDIDVRRAARSDPAGLSEPAQR